MAPEATSSAAPAIPNQDRRFKILYNGTDAPSLRVLLVSGHDVILSQLSAWVRARTDAGTGMPARRSGAGCGSPYWTWKGMTPAQVLPATSSAGSVGQAP